MARTDYWSKAQKLFDTPAPKGLPGVPAMYASPQADPVLTGPALPKPPPRPPPREQVGPAPVPPFHPPNPGMDPTDAPLSTPVTPPSGVVPPGPGAPPRDATQQVQAALGQAPPAAAAPAAPTDAGAAWGGTSGPTPGGYEQHLEAIAAAPTPQAAAAAQDALGWTLHRDLTDDGHEVAWSKTGNLVVDGKEYAVAGGPSTVTAGQDPQATPEDFNPASWVPPATFTPANPPNATAPGPASSTELPGGEPPPEPGVTPPPPNVVPPPGANAASFPGPGNGWSEGSQYAMPGWDQAKWEDPKHGGESAKYLAGHAMSALGAATEQNLAQIADYLRSSGHQVDYSGKGDRIVVDGIAIDAIYNVGGADAHWMWEPAGGGAGGKATNSPGDAGTWPPSSFGLDESSFGNEAQSAGLYDWSPSAPDYTPGQIGTQVGFEDMDPELAAALKDLLAHPTALDDRTVESMKAASAEEAAAAAQSQDEDLRTFGNAQGIGDSPWLASARAANQWDRRASTIASNRNVDITAAQTRMQDKRASINLVMDSVLRSASESRSRFGLNEELKQAATRLGLQKDQLVSNYLMHNIDDLTRRHQIDLGFKLDAAKLSQMSDQFKQDLMFRIMELRQRDEQFGAQYGLDLNRLQLEADRDAWAKAKDVYGGTT